MSEPTPSPPLPPYNVGDKFPVQWNRDDSIHLATIIESEYNSESNEWKFYVHYENFDRRLDEWVPETSVKPDATVSLPSTIDSLHQTQHSDASSDRTMTRQMKKKAALSQPSHHDQLDPATLELEKEHEELTKVKNIQEIQIGQYAMNTWYYSPFPEEIVQGTDKLYICEFCLKYMKKKESLLKHKKKCKYHHPPGDEIYRNDDLSVFEVDGARQKVYCQNLCLLAKLFLDHKTLYYDVDPFLFYIMVSCDSDGCHPVGYFSKEKNSAENYNLACILTLPCHQRKGYGRLLIEFSYELSKMEKKVGTPERPLSDLGRLGYMSYWKFVLINLLQNTQKGITIQELVDMTAIRHEDIVETLQELKLLGKKKSYHAVPHQRKAVDALHQQIRPRNVSIDPEKIYWIPYHERHRSQDSQSV
mmetsp:Transcript_406/g.1544  ORF Transcript_406/g.1544 Transcript_406/m.1544 type:complete len:417 (-) Transcript_406:878-2128(-)